MLSAASLPDALPRVAPMRPLPSEQPAKGFAWGNYEGVQVDGDTSSEDDGAWCLACGYQYKYNCVYGIVIYISLLNRMVG